jgi:hypothetical protein
MTGTEKTAARPTAPALAGSMSVEEIRANAAAFVRRAPTPPLSDAVIVDLRALFNA